MHAAEVGQLRCVQRHHCFVQGASPATCADGHASTRFEQDDEERLFLKDPRLDLHVYRPRSQVRGPLLAPAPNGRAQVSAPLSREAILRVADACVRDHPEMTRNVLGALHQLGFAARFVSGLDIGLLRTVLAETAAADSYDWLLDVSRSRAPQHD